MKKIVNGNKIELTQEQIAQRQIDEQQAIEYRLARIAKKEQKQLSEQSAINKLKALGLSEEEIKAIIGE